MNIKKIYSQQSGTFTCIFKVNNKTTGKQIILSFEKGKVDRRQIHVLILKENVINRSIFFTELLYKYKIHYTEVGTNRCPVRPHSLPERIFTLVIQRHLLLEL